MTPSSRSGRSAPAKAVTPHPPLGLRLIANLSGLETGLPFAYAIALEHANDGAAKAPDTFKAIAAMVPQGEDTAEGFVRANLPAEAKDALDALLGNVMTTTFMFGISFAFIVTTSVAGKDSAR